MRIFVFEYITGGGLADRPIVAGLAREGDLMLSSLIADLLLLPGIEVFTTRDSRLPDLSLPIPVDRVHGHEDLTRAWATGVRDADAVWPIAPESDGTLEYLCESVMRARRILLNSRPQGVRTASSKLATARRLEACGLPMAPTWSLDSQAPPNQGCWVLKPDNGVGCLGTRLIRDDAHLADAVAELQQSDQWILQPYIPGQAASLSLLIGDEGAYMLGCNRQRVVLLDDSFRLLGCEVNGLDGDRALYARLGRGVAKAIPGLWGYVGIDFVVTDEGPMILEVNPRLTTSYVGLSRSLGSNVAEMVIDLTGNPKAPPTACARPHRVDVDLEQCRVV